MSSADNFRHNWPMPEARKSYYRRSVEAFERKLIRRALQRHAGHIGDAAQSLGLTHRELRYRIEKLGLRERPWKLKPLE